MKDGTPLRLGFACSWWRPKESTWSYTPSRLLEALYALERNLEVQSIESQRPAIVKGALDLGQRFSHGDPWQSSATNRWLINETIRRKAKRLSCSAVLAMGLAEPELPIPAYFYQDLGYNFRLQFGDYSLDQRHPRESPLRRLPVLAQQERERFESCRGVFSMSRWYATWLVETLGLPTEKVHVVGGGINAVPQQRRMPRESRFRGRLLFVGRHFFRKGGDVVVEAVKRLRASGSGDFRLTVIGPAQWPLQGDAPKWVDFQGSKRPADVATMFASHDMLVLPSWFEAYGLAFLEARAGGLPCVAREAFAMPELVPGDRAGVLVPADGEADEVADAIIGVSQSDYLYEQVHKDADDVVRQNSWHAVANRMVDIIEESTAS